MNKKLEILADFSIFTIDKIFGFVEILIAIIVVSLFSKDFDSWLAGKKGNCYE